jgi:hypothetical protein
LLLRFITAALVGVSNALLLNDAADVFTVAVIGVSVDLLDVRTVTAR